MVQGQDDARALRQPPAPMIDRLATALRPLPLLWLGLAGLTVALEAARLGASVAVLEGRTERAAAAVANQIANTQLRAIELERLGLAIDDLVGRPVGRRARHPPAARPRAAA